MNTSLNNQTSQTRLEALLSRRPVIMQLLRFAAIGVINTSLDFLVLNFLSKTLGVESGLRLGTVNVVGFSLAIIQSYFWNRYWAFGQDGDTGAVRNFIRLVLVGGLGALAIVLVLLGAQFAAPPIFYLIVLAVFVLFQIVLWHRFAFRHFQNQPNEHKQFAEFVAVSLVGLLINSAVVALASGYFARSLSGILNPDLIKNSAKIAATAVSLVWNFIGYKLIVFRK